MPIDPDIKLRQGREHIATPIGGETAMMSLRRGRYYAVGAVAEHIWQMLEQPVSPREITEKLTTEYDVALDQCRREVNAFLSELVEEGLVEECPA